MKSKIVYALAGLVGAASIFLAGYIARDVQHDPGAEKIEAGEPATLTEQPSGEWKQYVSLTSMGGVQNVECTGVGVIEFPAEASQSEMQSFLDLHVPTNGSPTKLMKWFLTKPSWPYYNAYTNALVANSNILRWAHGYTNIVTVEWAGMTNYYENQIAKWQKAYLKVWDQVPANTGGSELANANRLREMEYWQREREIFNSRIQTTTREILGPTDMLPDYRDRQLKNEMIENLRKSNSLMDHELYRRKW